MVKEKEMEEKDKFEHRTRKSNYKNHLCPVCAEHYFNNKGDYAICPIYGWQNDLVMEDSPDEWDGCANDLCLTKFRQRYLELVKNDKTYRYSKDGIIE